MLELLLALASCKTRYGIMIDAGSSGTRAHIYTWEATKGIPNVQPAPNASNGWVLKKKIRIADAAKNMSVIPAIFDDVIIFASQRIPAEYLIKTRIFVYATAGMRLLPDVDQDRVIKAVYEYLKSKSPFKVKPKYVRVIDGIEEGVFGWLSVNHLLGKFVKNLPTVGALDMGGASFQIALEVAKGEKPLHTVTLGSKTIPLYAHSYLGYGANEAVDSITRSIIAVAPNDTIQHPCYPKGYKTTFKKKGINIIGTGDFEKCSSLAEQILLEASHFVSIEVPSLSRTNDFVAMASFFYANDFFKLLPSSTLDQLKNAATKFCAQDWSITEKDYPNNEYAFSYCWYGTYQYNLMTKGYKFADEKNKISKLEDINGVDLSWTIGAMLSHVGEIEIDEQPEITYPALIIANAIAFFVLLPIYIIVERMRKTPHAFTTKKT